MASKAPDTMMKKTLFVSLVLCSLLTSGCVVGRRTVALPIPTQPPASADKGGFHIAEVVDNRKFENKPRDASIPSIDGDVTSLSSEVKSSMIGRQRNTYGKAMGDIALPAGDSVVKRSRALLEEGLRRRGYTISDDPNAAHAASVSIDEFWAWFSPGMFAVSFEARVTCTLRVRKGDGSADVVIHGYGMNKGQVASDGNWQLAYTRAFEDFLAKMGPELDKAGL